VNNNFCHVQTPSTQFEEVSQSCGNNSILQSDSTFEVILQYLTIFWNNKE